jgi:carbamoyltransferase
VNVLGISCHYHDSAACLVRDGRVVAAVQEERFSRRKNDAEFPIRAINACLQQEGLTALDLDHVGFYEKPYFKLVRTILGHVRAWPLSYRNFHHGMVEWLSKRLTIPLDVASELAFKGPVLFVKHHLAHAASAFLCSPFTEAAILTADGLGEWATTSYGVGRGTDVEVMRELHYPDSLGLVYSAVTTYLGFHANSDEGRVMALAGYGEPIYLDRFREIVPAKDDGSYAVNERWFQFVRGRRMYGRRFVRAFGPPREPGGEIEQRHRDIAASLQRHLEESLLRIANHVHKETGMTKLCAAGGVFLNCQTNTRILEETPFEEIFIQPAAGDAGGALGVAMALSCGHLGQPRAPMTNAYLGPEYTATQIRTCLMNHGLAFEEMEGPDLAREVARLVADDKIVGFFQGRSEFGPRALGARSILANPLNPDMKDILNARVKHREDFRPYGVGILRDEVSRYFEFDAESPYMLLVARSRPEVRDRIPSALHIDGTSRLQTLTREENGLYHDVVEEFGRITGVPMVINTSFNDYGEPIVCSPHDACSCFLNTDIDALAIGPFLTHGKA